MWKQYLWKPSTLFSSANILFFLHMVYPPILTLLKAILTLFYTLLPFLYNGDGCFGQHLEDWKGMQ